MPSGNKTGKYNLGPAMKMIVSKSIYYSNYSNLYDLFTRRGIILALIAGAEKKVCFV